MGKGTGGGRNTPGELRDIGTLRPLPPSRSRKEGAWEIGVAMGADGTDGSGGRSVLSGG